MNLIIKSLFKKLPFIKKLYMTIDDLRKERNDLREYNDLRTYLGLKYIKGDGIEIGALHYPLKVSGANVKYVDRISRNELEKHYPEFVKYNFVNVDILDDGEQLASIENESLDFIIANHMLEHCRNPILTIKNHIKKLKKGGVLFYAIPDQRNPFDKDRELTTFEHLVNDYYGKNDDFSHYEEFSRTWGKLTDETEIIINSKKLMEMGYRIHFHTWTSISLFDFINKTNTFDSATNLYEL